MFDDHIVVNAAAKRLSRSWGSREDLVETLRRVSLFTQRQTPPMPVSLSFSEGAVEVAVRNGEVGEARERLPTTSEE